MGADSADDSNPPSASSLDWKDSATATAASSVMDDERVQRRSVHPGMKRVESRVPVRDVQDQPLLEQAKKLLDDQRSK